MKVKANGECAFLPNSATASSISKSRRPLLLLNLFPLFPLYVREGPFSDRKALCKFFSTWCAILLSNDDENDEDDGDNEDELEDEEMEDVSED